MFGCTVIFESGSSKDIDVLGVIGIVIPPRIIFWLSFVVVVVDSATPVLLFASSMIRCGGGWFHSDCCSVWNTPCQKACCCGIAYDIILKINVVETKTTRL